MLRLKHRNKPRLVFAGHKRAARESAEREVVDALAHLVVEDVLRPKLKPRLRLIRR